jgi:hypothetical protein
MRPPTPHWHPQPGPQEVSPGPGTHGGAFQGFRPLVSNFTQSPNEIVDLKLPGLTSDLRWTLHVLARETIGDAYQRGGSLYDFKAISWVRWMDLLELRSVNAVKARLARLEEMGLIEVQPGGPGPMGSLPNRYRLRWANDGRAASRIFHAVLRDRSLQMARKRSTREEGYQPADACQSGGYQSADTHQSDGYQPADTRQADTPSSEFSTLVLSQPACHSAAELSRLTEQAGTYFKNYKKENQPACPPASASTSTAEKIPSIGKTAGRQAGNEPGISLDLNLKQFLKGMGTAPWPELLFSELGKILSDHQVSVIEGRSPWSAEGAWAILETIRVRQDLDHKAAALWNGLLKQEKGALWLAEAGPWIFHARKVSGDNIALKTGPGSMGSEPDAHERSGCAPLPTKPLETHPSMQTQGLGGASGPVPHDNSAPQERKEWMTRQCETRVKRPEEFSPQAKAHLRFLIEHSRQAFRDFLQAPAANQPQALDAFTKAFRSAVEVLEPVLPVQVTLPEEHRPTEIRQRSQIKTNVLTAIYQAVS